MPSKNRKKMQESSVVFTLNQDLYSNQINTFTLINTLIKIWWLNNHLTLFCLAKMIREGFKYKNQISEGYIERKPEKDTIFHS